MSQCQLKGFKSEVHLAGFCGVDAGMIMIGDPCYGSSQKNHPSQMEWGEFCDLYTELREDYPKFGQLNYDLGHAGLGVVLDSGYGDGTYPVYVHIKDDPDWGRRIMKVEIFFDEDPYEPQEEEVA